MGEYNYLPSITSPTRMKSFLDHIFIRTKLSIESFDPVVVDFLITDHKPVCLKVKLPVKHEEKKINENKYKTLINYKGLRKQLEKEKNKNKLQQKHLSKS
ncbi:hypothetical protein JTB14_014705 [Gonioctena quinquepunctata]|nr:hypothetical protein JTB14_014705 [Gonioctena quinquepunctata]